MISQLEREITLSKILRSQKENDFFSTHTPIYGIHDDHGVESIFICDDWETIKGLNNLSEMLIGLDLRSRFNAHRNATVYIKWAPNYKIDMLKSGDLIHLQNEVMVLKDIK